MVSRSVGNSTPGALAAAGVPDETITVVLRLLDQFSRPWDRATSSMDVGMRRVEAGLNRFQHHAYQLEGLASRYTRARNEIATAEEQATERMTRSLRRAEGAIQSYDRVISGQTSLRGQQQQVQTRRRQDSDQLLNRAAFLEGEISRARQAQPIAEDRTRTLEGRIAGSRNLDMGMGHEDALFGMHQLRESRRQSQVYRSKLADIEQFQQATLRQSGIIDERLQNATGNRERMGGAIDSMRGARFRSAATVASYRATFPEAGRLIEEMGPDLGRHYFTRNLERGDAFPVPELHRDALKQFGGERRPSDFKSQLSQREFDAQVNREGGDEDSQWRAARRHYTSRSFTPETAADRQLQAMFNFDRHADALTMSARAPNRIIYPGDRQLGAEPGSDYGPVPTGPQRVQQGEDLRFRLDKQPQLYTTENYRNYVRQAEANFPTPGTSNEMWNVPSGFSTSRSDYRRMLRDPQEFSPFFVPPREREILFRKEMLGMDFDLESDPRLLSATGPFLDKAPTSNQESMRSMREWVGRPANRPLTQYRGRIYRTDPELPDDMRGELDDALFNRAPPYMEDRYRTAQLPKTYTGRGFMRKFTGALPDDLTGGGSAAADALEYIYALESRPHIGRELDFLEGEMPMTVASEADLGRRAEALQGDAATQSSLRDKFTSKYNAAVGRGDRLQEDLVNQLSLRESPAEWSTMQGRFNEWEDTHLRSRGLTLPSDLTAPVMVEPEGLARPMTLEQLQTEFQGIARAGQTVTPPSPTPGAWESARPVFPTRNPLITDPNELWEAVGDLGLSREQLSSQRSTEIERDLGPRDLRRNINRWSELTYHPQVSSGADPTQPAAWTVGDRPLTSDEQSERMDAAFNRYLEGQAGRDKEIFDANRGALERYDAQSDLSEITPSAFTDAEGAPLSRERWEQTRGSAQARTASVADWERELGQIRTEAGPDNYAAYIRKMERELEINNLQLARVDPNAEIAQDIGAPQRREARGHWRNMLQERMLDLTDVPDVEAVTGAADRTGMAQARIGEVEGQRMPFWQGELAQARSKKIALSEHFTSTFDWKDSLPDEGMVAGYMSDTDRLLSDFETNEAEMRQLQGRRKRATLPGTIASLDQDINSLHARQVETVNSLNAYWDPMEGELQAARADFDKESTNLNTLNERVTRASQFSPAQRGALDTEWDNVLASADKAEQARVRRDRAELDEQRTRRRGDTIADDAQHYERMTEVHKMRAEDAQSPADIEENKARTERSRKRAEELRWQQGSVQSFDLDAASANVTSAELGFQTAMRDREDAESSLGRMRQSFLGGADPLAAGRGKLADFEEDLRFKSQGMSVEGKKIIEQMMATQRAGDYMTPENLTELDQMLTEMDQVGTTASKTQGQTRDRLGMRRLQAPTKAQEIRTGLNRNIKRLEDAQGALAEREGRIGELPEGEDRERTAAEASRLRERLGPHSGATLGRLRDKRDEFDAVVQQEMMGAPLKRGADESDVEWRQRGFDREAGGFEKRMRDRKPRLGLLRETALSHLRFQEDTIRPMDTDPRLLGTGEDRIAWRTERDANQQIFQRMQRENAPLETELGGLEKLQTEDLAEWERLSQESRHLGPGVEAAQAQRQKIDSGSLYRRNLGATKGALIATYMTQTMQGLFLLTAGLSVVGMAMGMALMPLFDKMSKWWESVQKAGKGQDAVQAQIRSTNLALEEQDGILTRVSSGWDRKTGAALAGMPRSVQLDFNQNDINAPYVDMVREGLQGIGLDEDTARQTAIGMMSGGAAIDDFVLPNLKGVFDTDRLRDIEGLERMSPNEASQWTRSFITDDLYGELGVKAQRKVSEEFVKGQDQLGEPTTYQGDSKAWRTAGMGGSVGQTQDMAENRFLRELRLAADARLEWDIRERLSHASEMSTALDLFRSLGTGEEDVERAKAFVKAAAMLKDAEEDGTVSPEEIDAIEELLVGREPSFVEKFAGALQLRARGGTVGAGEITLVGEEGPEIVKLPPGSEVVPNERINDYGDWSADQSIGRREQVSRDGVLRDYGDWSTVQRQGQDDAWYEKHTESLQKTVIEFPGLGSGVMVDPSGIIATNRHVVEGHKGRYLSVELPGVGEFAAEVIYTDAEKDLAILRLVAPGNYESISLADSITKGERMAGVGFAPVTPERGAAGNVDMTFTPGTVTEDEDIGEGWRSWLRKKVGLEGKNPWAYDDLIKGSGYGIPGQSGGAMINEAGELLGITSRGVGGLVRERPYWMSKEIAGVPVDYLRTVLEELDITPRQGGGATQSGETTLVGEEGPEVVKLPSGSQVFPNGQGPSLSSGLSVAPSPNLTNDDWHDILRITTNRSKELTRGMGDFLAEMTESWVNTYDNMEKTTDSSLSAQFMRTLDLAEAFKFESDPEEEELGPSLSETHADSLLDLASFQAWANGALGSVRDASVAAFMAAYTEVAFPIGSGVHDTLQKITDWTAETVVAGYDWGLKTFNTAKGWFQSLWANETTDPEGESPDGDLPWYQDVMDWVTTTAVAGYKWGLDTFNTAKDWFQSLWENETTNPEGESPEEEPNTLQKVVNWVFDIAVLGYEWGLETFNTVKSWFQNLWTNKTTDPEGSEPDEGDGTLQQVVTWIAKTAVAAYDWGKETFNSLKTWAQNLWEATFGSSRGPEGASYGDDLAQVGQRSTLQEVVGWVGDAATAAYAWGKEKFNSLKTWAHNLWNSVPIEIDFGPEIKETLAELQEWLATTISNAWKDAKSAWASLRRRIRNLRGSGGGGGSSGSSSGGTSSSTPELPAVPPGPGAGDYMDADGNIHHVGDPVPGWTPPPDWAKMARGGTVLGAGWGMVGEEGPEIMNMPVGASVVPLPPGGYNRAMGSGNGEGRNLEISLVVDGHILKTMVVEMLDDYIRERAPDAMLV